MCVSLGWTSSAGILVIRNASSAALTMIRSTELGGSRQPELAAGAAHASSLGSRHSLMLRVVGLVHPAVLWVPYD